MKMKNLLKKLTLKKKHLPMRMWSKVKIEAPTCAPHATSHTYTKHEKGAIHCCSLNKSNIDNNNATR
jgi:hypothetical protein